MIRRRSWLGRVRRFPRVWLAHYRTLICAGVPWYESARVAFLMSVQLLRV